MNVTGASNGGKLRCHDSSLYPRSVLFFHIFRDVFLLVFSSLSAERRTSQRGWPVWRLANENEKLIAAAAISRLSLESAKRRGPDALEHERTDTYLLVRHLDSPVDRRLGCRPPLSTQCAFPIL